MKLCLTTQTLRQSLLLLVSVAFLAPDSRADTYVGGTISAQTWTKDAAPFLVTNNVYVSGSLNIKEGVEVRFLSNWVFEVGGKLRVFGSAAAPVVFQPADTNVGWQGLLFRDAVPGSFFVYTTIQDSKNSGVRITNTPPAFTNCVIQNNTSPGNGGGILAQVAGSPLILQSCVLSNNVAGPYNSGGFWGGGMCVIGPSIILDCLVVSNRTQGVAAGDGGGLFVRNGDCTMRNTQVLRNTAGNDTAHHYGDGIYFDYVDGPGTLEMANCVVSGNGTPGAAGECGGLYVNGVAARVRNCIFANNAHDGIRQGSGSLALMNCTVTGNIWQGLQARGGTASVTNCIFYFNYNSDQQIYPDGLPVGYSCVQGGYPGTGNIIFTPSLCPDTLSLLEGSPCIDAGEPGLEFRDGCVSSEDCSPYARGGSRNDMGAYGGPGVCNWTDPRPEPVIRINPDNAIAALGLTAQMGVIATGNEPLSYQWYREGTAWSGQTNSVLTLPGVVLGQAGSWTVVVSNALGSPISQPVQLMVSKLAVTPAGFDQGKPVLHIANGARDLVCAIHATNVFAGGDTYAVGSQWPKVDTITMSGAET